MEMRIYVFVIEGEARAVAVAAIFHPIPPARVHGLPIPIPYPDLPEATA